MMTLDSEQFEFQECPECSKKPGTPTLCSSCLNNRHIIQLLQEKLESKTNTDTYLFHVIVLQGERAVWGYDSYVIATSEAVAEYKVKNYYNLDTVLRDGYIFKTTQFATDFTRDGSEKITKHEILI